MSSIDATADRVLLVFMSALHVCPMGSMLRDAERIAVSP